MKHKGHKLFARLFSLIAGMITLLTILVLIIGTAAIRNFLKESTLDATREKLGQKQYILEYTLENIERTAFSLAQDNNFHKFVLLPENVNERYPVWKDIVDKMNDTMNSFDMIDSLYLYPFEKDRDILSNKGVISRKDFSDRLFISRLSNKSFNQWQQTRPYAHGILSPITEDPTVMSYVKTVPAQDSMARGLLVINIRVAGLNEILKPVNGDDRIILMSREGIILLDSLQKGTGSLFEGYRSLPWQADEGDFQEQRGERGINLLVRKESRYSGWMYFYFASAPYRNTWILFVKALLILTGLFLFLGIITAYFISYVYTKPWELLVEEFATTGEEDELAALSHTIRNLQEENQEYREKNKIFNEGYLAGGSGRLLVTLEDKMDRWKRGILLWEKGSFLEETGDLISAIKTGNLMDTYKILLIHEVARALILTLCRRGPRGMAGNDPINEDVLLVLDKKVSIEEKGEYLLKTASLYKDYLDQNSSRPQDELINNLLTYLDDHYREEIYTDSMAAKLNLSESYFCRLVKDVTGKTFNELLGEIRFREVCRLLRETGESLECIAELTGLKSKRNLLRNFKKFRDETPGQYRQKTRLDQKMPLN